jgi:hypothetical protein
MESATQFTPAEVERIAKAVGVTTPSDPFWPQMNEMGHGMHKAMLEMVEAVLREVEQVLANR